jgi:tRNA pseudouridine55 synthase
LPDWPDHQEANQKALPEVLPPEQALSHLTHHLATEAEREDWRCGRRLQLAEGLANQGDTVMVLQTSGPMLGIGIMETDELLRPKVVFNAHG